MLLTNLIDKWLSDVSLEMLSKFFVIEGTSKISLSAIYGWCCLVFKLLKIRNASPMCVKGKPCPFSNDELIRTTELFYDIHISHVIS